MFHVINLKRRSDRKESIIEKFKNTGLNLDSLIIHEAIDGINGINSNLISSLNDFDNNPRIAATALSHYNIWIEIAESDNPFGVILEDDINFHPDFKKRWLKIKTILKGIRDPMVIYTGMGDFLPIHTNPPSESLLRAQEKSHIIKGTEKLGIMGEPDVKSAYIFDWFGAFSYIVTKSAAQKLVKEVETYKFKKAVDVWIKDCNIKKYLTNHLLKYNYLYKNNMYDSDTWGISTF